MYYFEESENGYHCKSNSIKELKEMITRSQCTGGNIYKGNILYALVKRETKNFQGQKYYEYSYERC